MERGILAGLAAYRWAAWGWMAAVLLLSQADLVNASLSYALVAAALVISVEATVLLRTRPDALLRPAPVLSEVATGAALVAGDGWAYGPGHAFSVSQSLAVAWPLAGVLGAGVSGGPWAGAAAGVLMGGCRALAAWGNGVREFGDGRVLSLTTTAVLYVLAGAVAGHVTQLLRRAEREVSAARVREEMARALHDGVLQTLAVIERRADDPALARLARDQERQLRDYIAGVRAGDEDRDLAAALRAAAARFEEAFDGRAEIVVAPDLPPFDGERAAALAGAAGEAIANAGKHGAARRVTIFVEPDADGGVFCSVRDDGRGFDPSDVAEGLGITRSIRHRLAEAGGRAEIESRPGGPTEVRMWIP